MSQHDYDLANQTGASFRADLNNALAAILSQNSGATEPVYKVAYMFWADTTSGILKQRNAANSAWVNKGTLSAAPVETTGATFTGDLILNGASVVFAEGAAVTAATTADIWATDGNTRHIVGNTTIDSFGSAPQAGAVMYLIFDGVPLLTQSTNMNLNNGGNNIQIEAGDLGIVYADTTSQMDVFVIRKSGKAVSTIGSFTQLNLTGELNVGGDPGTLGQVLVSAGDNAVPEWVDFPSSGFRNIAVFTSSGTFNVPSTVDKVKVTVVGGGGGGADITGNPGRAGGGGGAGAAVKICTVTPGSSISVTVGGGGGGGGSSANGGAGGTSSFGSFCSASGGSGGLVNGSAVGGGIGSNGDLNLKGGYSVSSTASTAGAGGTSYYSQSQRIITAASNGVAGEGYGAGGGGGLSSIGAAFGGAGASGVVVVEY